MKTIIAKIREKFLIQELIFMVPVLAVLVAPKFISVFILLIYTVGIIGIFLIIKYLRSLNYARVRKQITFAMFAIMVILTVAFSQVKRKINHTSEEKVEKVMLVKK